MAVKQKILIVDDDNNIAELISLYLTKECYDTKIVNDGEEAVREFHSFQPNLILLDLMLPGMDGYQVCREIRHDSDVPIIMLSAKGEVFDKVLGLELGADDYITKPFSPKELTARLKAVIRRAVPTSVEEVIEVQGLKLDPVSHRVTVEDQPLDMGPTEFRLLHFFMTHPERVYSREQLLNNVWGTNVYVEDRTVDVHIRRLRKAIADSGHDVLIQTVRGSGYRFSTRL